MKSHQSHTLASLISHLPFNAAVPTFHSASPPPSLTAFESPPPFFLKTNFNFFKAGKKTSGGVAAKIPPLFKGSAGSEAGDAGGPLMSGHGHPPPPPPDKRGVTPFARGLFFLSRGFGAKIMWKIIKASREMIPAEKNPGEVGADVRSERSPTRSQGLNPAVAAQAARGGGFIFCFAF